MNKTLVWILAGGAAVALGGVAVWLWRRRVKSAALVSDDRPQTPPPKPQPPGPPGDEMPLLETDPELDVSPAPRETTATAETAAPPARRRVFAVDALRELDLRHVEAKLSAMWPTRPRGPELEPELGDHMAFVARARDTEEQPGQLEVVVGRILAIDEETFEIEVIGSPSRGGVRTPALDHGYTVGQHTLMFRSCAAAIIKPEPPPVLVPKNRRKRYRVEPGELIELRPDTRKALPEAVEWQPSRPDVALRVVEQDESRTVVALDGPVGEVNVALLAANSNGETRPVCSWKFELVEGAA